MGFGGKDLVEIEKEDIENMSKVYRAKDVYENLGLSRETLRYYEEIGIINLKRSDTSQYREFDFFDIFHLMAIDFYKKRGFSSQEIKQLMNAADQNECSAIINNRIQYMEKELQELQGMLNRLKNSKQYYDNMQEGIGNFVIRDMPLYIVRDSIDRVTSFHEYKDKVIGYLNLKNEDILSNMVRSVTFDENGYKGSDMCIFMPAEQGNAASGETLLKGGKCLYTTIVADNDDNSIMEKMFEQVTEWSKEHHTQLCGVAYIFIRFITLNGSAEKNYYEVWIPIK